MLSRTHFTAALFIYLILFLLLPEKFIFGVFLLLATFLVDIDSKTSKLGKFWIFRPLQIFFKHRGIFHSLFTGLILSLLLYFLSINAALGFLLGFYLHLFLDCLTKGGVRLFWPLSNFKVKGLMKSGSLFEEIIFVLLLLIDVFLVGKLVMMLLST